MAGAEEVAPSWRLALERARDQLLKDPLTNKPYPWWGFTAPTSIFLKLGEDTHTYMNLLQDSLVLGVLGTMLSIYPMWLSASSAYSSGLSPWGMTSIGASERVEWGHVLCDIAITVLFVAFFDRQQRRTMVADKGAQIATYHKRLSTRKRKSPAVQLCPSLGRSTARIGIEADEPTNAAGSTKAAAQQGEASAAALVVQKSFRGYQGRQRSLQRRGGSQSGPAETSPRPARTGAPSDAAASGRSSSGSGSARSRNSVTFREGDAAPPPRGRHPRGSARGGSAVGGPTRSSGVSSGETLIPQLKVQGTMRTMANAGEACSVVVWGWEAGEEMPSAALDAMEHVAGQAPWAVLQPHACAEAQRLYNRLHELSVTQQRLLKTKSAKELHRARDERVPSGESASERKLAKQLSACEEEMLNISAAAKRVAEEESETGREGDELESKGGAPSSRSRLPLAFVTFETVIQARRVLHAFRGGFLWPRAGASTPAGAERAAGSASGSASGKQQRSAAEISSLQSLCVNPAPNALDIRWEYLEIPARERARRLRKGYCLITLLTPVATMMVVVSVYFAFYLHAAPPFTYCPPPANGTTADCTLTVGILFTNFGNWLWTTLLIISAFQLIIQPVLWLSTDGGPCGPKFAEATTSYTEACMHLMLRVLVFQILGTVVAALFFIPIAGWDVHFWGESVAASAAAPLPGEDAAAVSSNRVSSVTGTLGVRIYDMGGGVLFNTILGDSLLINLVIDGFLKPDYLVPLLLARSAPTQQAMDEQCSMSNVLLIPFRVQLLAKTLCLVIIFSAGMPILMPLLLLFCLTAWPMDRLNLLARFAPPPLTNDLALRFVLSSLLPPILFLHSVMGSLFFLMAERVSGYTYAEIFARGPVACYFAFTACLTIFLLSQSYAARRRAIKNGVLTPYQLCCAPCVVDDGFHLASMAATEKVGGMGIALPDIESARRLYRPPTCSIASDSSLAEPPPKSAWLSRSAHQERRAKLSWRKLNAAVALAGTRETGARDEPQKGTAAPPSPASSPPSYLGPIDAARTFLHPPDVPPEDEAAAGELRKLPGLRLPAITPQLPAATPSATSEGAYYKCVSRDVKSEESIQQRVQTL